jgi:multimeric flavodoxin WrbA
MEMLVVGLNGSPDRDGETAALLRRVLEACAERDVSTALIHVADALVGQDEPYCSVCCGYTSGGELAPCPENCHRVEELARAYELLRKADALVVGSPVYFGTVTAQLKAFWDKSRNLRAEKALINKPTGAVVVGEARFGGQENTLRTIHDILLLQGMRIVGDTSMASGAGHHGVCAQRPVAEDEEALKRCRVLAEAVMEAMESGG